MRQAVQLAGVARKHTPALTANAERQVVRREAQRVQPRVDMANVVESSAPVHIEARRQKVCEKRQYREQQQRGRRKYAPPSERRRALIRSAPRLIQPQQ